MRRIELKPSEAVAKLAEDLPDDLMNYLARLKLLYDVPFSYLVAEEQMLPVESLRFFYLNGNWTDALAAGALSIGRVSATIAEEDKRQLSRSAPLAQHQLQTIRQRMMHENHKRVKVTSDSNGTGNLQTGFLLRSVLARRMKGLEVTGSAKGTALKILRMEMLSNELLICIFDGELDSLVIAEPKTGLRFGCPDDSRVIRVRAITDDDHFGKYQKDKVDVGAFTETNGKLNVSKLAEGFGKILGAEVGSAQLAFELIATACRAEFVRK